MFQNSKKGPNREEAAGHRARVGQWPDAGVAAGRAPSRAVPGSDFQGGSRETVLKRLPGKAGRPRCRREKWSEPDRTPDRLDVASFQLTAPLSTGQGDSGFRATSAEAENLGPSFSARSGRRRPGWWCGELRRWCPGATGDELVACGRGR